MDKLYTEDSLPVADTSLHAPLHVEKEHIKKSPVVQQGKVIITAVNKTSPLEKKFNRFLKRSFDIVFSTIFIIGILSWLTPLIAILIKIDSRGPVFFLQRRTGLNRKSFTCIKFRTMFMNAEADLLPEQENDKRITKPGRFLRLYHIDELPQFINVLSGDMSIIGPRPYMFVENRKFEHLFAGYSYRHTVKPGITGFAQASGNFGASTDLLKLKQRTRLDNLYIQRWSPLMDAKIILRTLRMVAKK